jgi:hypothetical protein
VLTYSEALQRVGDPLEGDEHLLEPVDRVDGAVLAAHATSPGHSSRVSQDHSQGVSNLF